MSSMSLLLQGVVGLMAAMLLPSLSSAQSTFTFNIIHNTTGSFLWNATQQYLRPLNRPIPYVSGYNYTDSDNAWGVAAPGTFLLWGCQPDVSFSPDGGYTWTYVAGTAATNSHLDTREINPRFPGVGGAVDGNAGCNHRGTFNRFYLMGNAITAPGLTFQTAFNPYANATINPWFNWASNDGSIWNQVMSSASAAAMTTSRNFLGGSATQNHICVVDQKDNVYSVGSYETYFSNSLGVNWVKYNSVTYFSPRWGISGGIYSPSTTQDTIVVLGGTGVSSYQNLLNDVWTSNNGGLAWTQLTAAAPWPGRQAPNFAINSNGVMVLYGGDCGGGWCGVWGDAWVSVNGGQNWYLLNQAPGLNMTLTAMAFDNAGFLWLVGGQALISGNDYFWMSAVQKSSLSFSTSALSTWSSSFTGGQTFPAPSSTLQQGLPPMGGASNVLTSNIPIVSAFSCANTVLPNTGALFNMTYLDNGNGWGAIDIAMAQAASPILYGMPWSGSSTSYDPVTGYWYGTAWGIAPAGSLVQWGGQPDVAISTNSGTSWTWIAGAGQAGLGWAASDYNAQAQTNLQLGAGNAECAHRSTFNRFYVIGNNGVNNATAAFEVWAANDAQIWTQVLDTASASAMAGAALTNTVPCVVGADDNIYYLAGSSLWVSNSLGRAFTPATPTTYYTPRQFHTAGIYAPSSLTQENIVIVGGQATNGVWLNDVWMSTSYGQSWTQQSATAPFLGRGGVNMAVSANGVIVFHGGTGWTSATGTLWFADVWASGDNGATWTMLVSNSGVARAFAGTVFDNKGFFLINSGQGPSYSWNNQVYISTYSLNNIGQWGPKQVPTLTPPAGTTCTQGTAPTTFDFTSWGTIPWGAIDQFVRPTQVPITYVTSYSNASYGGDGKNQWNVAPAGSWVMWGTQPDISISTNNGKTWTITSGTTSGNGALDTRDLTIYPTGTGNTGCNHRGTFNRFYLIGNCNGGTCSGSYFNWATQDAEVWYEVMDVASGNAMMKRVNMTQPFCVVDQKDNVYYVGGADTWKSTNLGVTFTAVSSSKYFTPRTQMAGGIYSPTSTTDTIVVVGGTGAQDIWSSADYGVTWTQTTSSLPWTTRGNINFGISQNGVFVAVGGDLNGGNAAEYNDVWVSLTQGQSWNLVSTGGALPGISLTAVTFDSQGYMYLLGGQTFQYQWTGTAYRSTLPLLNISTWSSQLSGNGASTFSVPSNYIAPTGALPMGGVTGAPSFVTPVTSAYSCSNIASLPQYNPNTPFDIVKLNSGDGWGNAMNGMAVTVAPIVYEVPWANSSVGTWEGNPWAVAPARSFLVWGGNSDVQISPDNGNTWTAIGGIGGYPGLAASSQSNYDSGTAQSLSVWNTQCAHRGTFNRFYVMGNNQGSDSASAVPFAGWASGDGLTWTEVMDGATSAALATDRTSGGLYLAGGQCLVDINDNVYYISGARTWVSNTLGVSFVAVNSTSAYMDAATRGTRANFGAVITQYVPGVDRILVIGGQTNPGGNSSWINDVWSSTTGGLTWRQTTAAAPWSGRQSPNVAVSQSGVLVLVGGMAYVGGSVNNWVWYGDAWASLDNGASWTQLSSAISIGPVAYGGIVIDNNGYILLSGGFSCWSCWSSTVARSTYSINNIQQWITSVNANPVIPAGYCPVTAYVPGTNGAGGSSSSSKLSGGAIAGIVIGSVAGVLLILLVLFVLCRGGAGKKNTSYETHQEQSRVQNSEVEPSHGGAVEMQETDA